MDDLVIVIILLSLLGLSLLLISQRHVIMDAFNKKEKIRRDQLRFYA